MTIDQNNYNNDEMSLKEILIKINELIAFLKTKWKILIISCLIGGSLGLLFSILIKPTYKATLTFAMEEDKGGAGGLSGALGLASSFGIDLGGAGGGGAFASSNLAEFMKSRLIVEKVLLSPVIINGETVSLVEYYIQFNGLREKWGKENSLKTIHFSPNTDRSRFTFTQDSIFQQIIKKITDKDHLSIIQKDKKVTILYIDVISENELFAKIFCENIAKETSEFYIQTKSKKAKINVDVLQKQVDSVRLQLNAAISGVALEADNVYNLNPAFNVKGATSKKKQIDVQANTAILTNLVVQLELAKISLRKETPLIQLIDRPVLPLEKESYGKAKSIILGSLFGGILVALSLTLNLIYRKLLD